MGVNDAHDRIIHALEKVGLPNYHNKRRPALASPTTGTDYLGTTVWRDGVITPRDSFLFPLLYDTLSLVRQKGATPRSLHRLLGRWVWVLLLRRPFLSVLSTLYDFVQLPGLDTRHELDTSQILEL